MLPEASEQQMQDDLTHHPIDVEIDLRTIASQTSYWAAQYAQASEAYLNAEHDRKRVEAKLYLSIKAKATEKRLTVDEINSLVRAEAEYNDFRLKEIKAEARMIRLKGMTDAIRAKRDSIMGIANIRLQEMKADPNVRDDQAKLRRAQGHGPMTDDDFADPPASQPHPRR